MSAGVSQLLPAQAVGHELAEALALLLRHHDEAPDAAGRGPAPAARSGTDLVQCVLLGPGEASFIADFRPTSSSSASIPNPPVNVRSDRRPSSRCRCPRGCGRRWRVPHPRRLDGHGRAFAEGTIEHQALVCRAGQFVQHPALLDVLLQVGVQRAASRESRRDARARCASLAQVDQHDVAAADDVPRLLRQLVIAQPRRAISCWPRLAHVRRHRHVHHLRIGQVQVVHQRLRTVHRLHLKPRIQRFSSAIVLTVSPL